LRKQHSIESIAFRKAVREDEVKELVEAITNKYGKNKYGRAKIRLLANDMLRLLKPNIHYSDLSKITGIPESVLCRYVRGSIIPSFEHAATIIARLALSIDIDYLLRSLVEEEKSNIIDLSRVLKDPYIVKLLSIIIYLKLIEKEVTKIVATAESVLPLATLLAIELAAPVVLVKRKAYPGVHYYTAIIPRSPKDTETIYIDKDLISRKDSVFVLADVVYTGRTLKSVLAILEKAKVNITDIVVVLALGEAWRKTLKEYELKVLTNIPYPL